MRRPRIVFLGAGSAVFTERLVADLIRRKEMPPCDVVMHDTDPEVLKYMTTYTRMLVEREGAPITVTAERTRPRAFDGADFIIITLTVGGPQQDILDVEVPLKYGVFQTVGDTLGPGGLMRIFRSFATYGGFVKDILKYCPRALVINFSNPMTMVCRLMNRLSNGKIKVVGLCHGTWGTVSSLAGKLGINPEDVDVLPAGVNHFVWFLELTCRGKDLYPLVRRELLDKGKGADWPVTMELLRIYGYYPSPGCRHLSEFVPYYLKDKRTMKKYNLTQRDNREVRKAKARARKACKDVAAGKKPLPPLKASGEQAMQIISSVVNNSGGVFYANVPNRGFISNLPDEVVVEVPCRFDRKGPHGVKVGPLPQGIKSHMVRIIETQELGVEASMRGDRNMALQAFLSDPLARDVETCGKMLDEMLRKSRKWVPQFFRH